MSEERSTERAQIPEPIESVPRPTPLNFSEITSGESSLFNKTEDTSNLTEDKTFEDDKGILEIISFIYFNLENRLGNATTRAARLDILAATVDSHLKVQ